MRVATWNVNSIRTRVARTVEFLVREDVDAVAMQEIKCTEAQFPRAAFEEAGYEVVLHGLNQWNGVAIASRHPIEEVEVGFDGMPGFLKGEEGPDLPREARSITATTGGVRLQSVYVPNGRGLNDPHYAYKLDWFAALGASIRARLAAHPDEAFAVLGDFNVVPFDEDNGDPTVVVGATTHVSPPERAAFAALQDEVGLTDVVRPLVPTGYTYWDYKQLRFPRNEGLRIDFVLGSRTFADAVTAAAIHRNERKGEQPSDHVPVTVDLELDAPDDDAPWWA